MFSSCLCGDEGGELSEAGFTGWGGFSGWVGLWMEVVVRIGICVIAGWTGVSSSSILQLVTKATAPSHRRRGLFSLGEVGPRV